jgi:hypothetical protein
MPLTITEFDEETDAHTEGVLVASGKTVVVTLLMLG